MAREGNHQNKEQAKRQRRHQLHFSRIYSFEIKTLFPLPGIPRLQHQDMALLAAAAAAHPLKPIYDEFCAFGKGHNAGSRLGVMDGRTLMKFARDSRILKKVRTSSVKESSADDDWCNTSHERETQ